MHEGTLDKISHSSITTISPPFRNPRGHTGILFFLVCIYLLHNNVRVQSYATSITLIRSNARSGVETLLSGTMGLPAYTCFLLYIQPLWF